MEESRRFKTARPKEGEAAASRPPVKSQPSEATAAAIALLKLFADNGQQARDIAEVLTRYRDVAATLKPEVALQLLLMSDGNDMVAMEHMFSPGGAFNDEEPSGRQSDAADGNDPEESLSQNYEVRHQKAVEKLEMGVRMQQAKLQYEREQRLVEKNMLAAEKRRGQVDKAVTSILENTRLWAYPVIEHFKRRRDTTPTDVRNFMEKIAGQLDQQQYQTSYPQNR